MTICESDIAANCSDVSKGQGRITACLYANGSTLSAKCKAEVDKFNDKVLKELAALQASEYEAGLRKACERDADLLCPGVLWRQSGIFACLYARQTSISEACALEAQRALDQVE